MVDIDRIFSEWSCPKCGFREKIINEHAFTGVGLTRIFDLQMYGYIAIVCKQCGYTEFYSMDILFEKPEFLKKEDEVTIKIKSDRNLIQLYNRLLRIYQTKYPHNPEGVLRFHISRQLKFEKDKDLELILRKLLRNIKHK